MITMKLNALKLALTEGIVVAICYDWTTIASLNNISGFMPFAKSLESGYGFYGYSIS